MGTKTKAAAGFFALGGFTTAALLLSLGATPGNYRLSKRGHTELSQAQAVNELDAFMLKHFLVSAAVLKDLHCVAAKKSISDKTPVLRCSANYLVEKPGADALTELEASGAVQKIPDE